MIQTMRTFIAIQLPDSVIASIRKVQQGIRSHGIHLRWVKPENIHLTLKFLGDTKKDDIEKITQTIYNSVKSYDPISLFAKGVGVFPGLKRPRVVWVGVSGEVELLVALQKHFEQALECFGFAKEQRRFKGHLTIGRVKGRLDPKKLGNALKELQDFTSEMFYAEHVVFYSSELRPTGAVYSMIAKVPLGV